MVDKMKPGAFGDLAVKSNLARGVAYFRATWATSQPKPQKAKKIHSEKNSLYFRKWNFLTLIFKKFLYFLKRKLFNIFSKESFSCIFTKESFSYIYGNRTLHFSSRARKIKEI